MKTITSISIFILVLTGCTKSTQSKQSHNVETKPTEYNIGHNNALTLLNVDGCEYLYGPWGNATVLTHKGNCNNKIHKINN